MFERVIATLDGSRFAEAALPYAAALRDALGSDLVLLRVAHEGEAFDAQKYVENTAGKLAAKGTALPAHGVPGEAILRELESEPKALVVMATHGRSGLMETVMGSVASAVVQKVEIPVLLLRPADDAAGLDVRPAIKSIVVTLDGSEYSERIVGPAVELAKGLGAGVKVVQVVFAGTRSEAVKSGDVLETSYVRSRAEKMRDDYGIDPDWDVLHGDPAEAISDSVEGAPGAMLAMASHARKPISKAVLGSVTSACLRRAGVPVLVVGPNYQ